MAAALDELRFGPQRTLNLRDGSSVPDAIRRTETWLREHQLRGTKEVLVITGRGNQSIGRRAVIRPAVEKLLFSLRRRGIIASHQDHNPGAFAVELAPLRALAEAPRRRRERTRATPSGNIAGLGTESLRLLRDLAERSLDALGITPTEATLVDEMHRHLRLLAPGLTGDQNEMERQLQRALRAAIAEYD